MKNIKTFYKEHKAKIIVGCCMIGSAVVGALVYKSTIKEAVDPYQGKSVISWVENGGYIGLEEVKEVLDLNANNNASFAIFKEGVNSDDYGCILLNDDVVIPERSEEA